jgi:hypothetical protein
MFNFSRLLLLTWMCKMYLYVSWQKQSIISIVIYRISKGTFTDRPIHFLKKEKWGYVFVECSFPFPFLSDYVPFWDRLSQTLWHISTFEDHLLWHTISIDISPHVRYNLLEHISFLRTDIVDIPHLNTFLLYQNDIQSLPIHHLRQTTSLDR